jgi:hypothetical protein
MYKKDKDSRKLAVLRKNFTAADGIVLSSLAERLELTAAEDDESPQKQPLESIDKSGQSPDKDDVPASKGFGFVDLNEGDLGQNGGPSIFAKGNALLDDLEGLGLEDMLGMAPRLEEVSMVEHGKDGLFDEEGFPAVTATGAGSKASGPAVQVDVIEIEDDDDEEPIDPNPKRRKAAVLACRAKLTTAKKSRSSVAGATSSEPSRDDEPLFDPKISGPTNEAKPRVQLLAKSKSNSRVFVCTLHVHICPSAHSFVSMIAERITAHGWTKRQCLDYKQKLCASVNLD